MKTIHRLGFGAVILALGINGCKSTSGGRGQDDSEIKGGFGGGFGGSRGGSGPVVEGEVDHESYSPVTGDIVLPKGPETVLVYNSEGPSALVRVDKQPQKIADVNFNFEVETDADDNPIFPSSRNRISSIGGKFFIVAEEKLLVIDGGTGKLEKSLDVPKAKGYIPESLTAGYIFTANEIIQFNPSTGKTGKSLPFEAQVWSFSDQHLLATNHLELALIDRKTFELKKISYEKALAPIIKADQDDYEKRKKDNPRARAPGHTLLVPMLGVTWHRATNTVEASSSSQQGAKGGRMVINLNAGTAKYETTATYTGASYFLNKIDRYIDLQHTQTPTSSTHVSFNTIDASGKTKSFGAPIFDLFDVNNNLQFNATETAATMGSACFSGGCTAGRGVILYDLLNNKRLPNITQKFLGFKVRDAFFLAP